MQNTKKVIAVSVDGLRPAPDNYPGKYIASFISYGKKTKIEVWISEKQAIQLEQDAIEAENKKLEYIFAVFDFEHAEKYKGIPRFIWSSLDQQELQKKYIDAPPVDRPRIQGPRALGKVAPKETKQSPTQFPSFEMDQLGDDFL